MKSFICVILLSVVLSACVASEKKIPFNPDYNRYAENVSVVSQNSLFVTYEYKNIRVDEIAALAALYCQSQNNKQAVLYDIVLHKNNSRRATFACEENSTK